jgi:hypothetical protein
MSNLMIPTASMLVIAGIMQIFLQAISLRQEKRGRIQMELRFHRWSLRSIYPGAIMILTGALLLGIGPW